MLNLYKMQPLILTGYIEHGHIAETHTCCRYIYIYYVYTRSVGPQLPPSLSDPTDSGGKAWLGLCFCSGVNTHIHITAFFKTLTIRYEEGINVM